MLVSVLIYLSVIIFSITHLIQGNLFIYGAINYYCIIFWATSILMVLVVLKRTISANIALYSAVLITYYSQVLYEEFAMIALHDITWALGVALVLVPFIFFANEIKTMLNFTRLVPFITGLVLSNFICFIVYPFTYPWSISIWLAESLFMIARLIGFVCGTYFLVPATIKWYKDMSI